MGHDGRGIDHIGHDGRPALAPLSCPPVLFVMPPVLSVIPAGPLCHSRRPLSVMPPGTLCHSRRPPLSCPPVSPITNVGDKVSGNPVSCFVVLLFVWPLHGRSHGFPIKNVGNDRRGIEHGGHDGMSALPLCHARWAPSVMPAGFPDNKCRGQG